MLRYLSCFLILSGIVSFSPLPAAGLIRPPVDIVRPPIDPIIDPIIDIRPDLRIILPAAPTGLNATATATQITLAWQDNANNETGYKIERSVGGGQWSLLTRTSLAAGATGYTDSTIQPGVIYDYRVFAFNANGNSDYSDSVSACFVAVPSNLHVEGKTSTEITIAWAYKGTGQTSFAIQCRTGSGSWKDIRAVDAGDADAGDIYFIDTGLQPDTTYSYRVMAKHPAGDSGYTSPLVATTNQPAPVTNINNVTNNNTNTTNNANTEVNISNSNINNSNIASNNKINQTNTVSNITNASTVTGYAKIIVNGEPLVSDVTPFLNKDGRVMVPFRAIGEKLGAFVDWDAAARTAILSIEDVTVKATVNKQAIDVNGAEQQIDTFAVIKNGRTFIPLRAVSQALGAQVGWEQATKTATISM